ncbi:YqaJ viral recombinase family protein [Viridibacillus sp. FSL E2-0187]|uniref:YqaJ viral recombinase family nuclease n=1 Tax=Viridibacillus sp. FSL E2-0187 TaxID=2921362 RepID=UPI0030F647B3
MFESFANTAEMSRGEWLDVRRSGIGGSDAAVILGFNKWKSPFQLYLEKTGDYKEESDNEFIYWGNVLEDVVAKEFQERTGKKVRKKNQMLRHKEHQFMTANLDRVVVGEKAFLECKTTSAYKNDDWDGDEIPAAYLCQVQHYMAVTGFEKAYIAVLIGGNKFVWKEIERDEELIQIMIEREKYFWENHVLAKVPPEIDGSDAAVEFISKRYTENPDEVVMLDTDKEKIINALENVKAEIKGLEELEKKYTNQLKMSLETASEGVTENYRLTYKTINQNRIDSRLLREELPNIFKKYTKQSSYRKFGYKKVN